MSVRLLLLTSVVKLLRSDCVFSGPVSGHCHRPVQRKQGGAKRCRLLLPVLAEMAPQPVQEVLGGLRPASQPARKTSGELDEERKQELIMEKKLRACRVSILPKVRALGKM